MMEGMKWNFDWFKNYSFIVWKVGLASTVLLLILDWIGLRVLIDWSLLYWFLFGLTGLTAIAYRKEIISFAKSNRRFIAFNLGFIALSLIYVAAYILLSYGSPFVYEDPLNVSHRNEFTPLEPGQTLQAEYHAQLNNLGTINLAFKPEVPDAKEEALVFDTGAIQEFPVTFSISEKDQDPFYTNDYTLMWTGNQQFTHPFGFPIQEFSKNNHYLITLSVNRSIPRVSQKITTPIKNDGSIFHSGRYVIPFNQAIQNTSNSLDFLTQKSKGVLADSIQPLIIIYLSIIFIFTYIWISKKGWMLILVSGFVLSTSLIFIFQLSFWWSQQTISTSPLAILIYYLISLATVMITGIIYKSKTSLIKDLSVIKSANSNNRKKKTTLVILLLMLLALALRLPNLSALDPYTDEYPHLLAAKQIVENTTLMDEPYTRSYYTVTLPVTLSFQLIGQDLTTARIPGAIFNVLAMIPLFLIVKRINRKTAYLALLLYAVSPWIIAVSRNVREYAYYPFYFYWLIFAMLKLLETLPAKLASLGPILNRSTILWSIPLIFAPVFALVIDPLSTFKIALLAYLPFIFLISSKIDLSSKYIKRLLLLLISGLIIGIYQFSTSQAAVDLSPTYSNYWLRLFFGNPGQQSYFNLIPLAQPLILISALFGSILVFRKNKAPIFFTSLFGLFLYFFVFHFDRYFRPRYAFSVQFWYIIVMAIGLGILIHLIQKHIPHNSLRTGLIAIIFILTINPLQSVVPITHTQHGYVPITFEFHDRVEPVHKYISENIDENQVLISSNYHNYLRWQNDISFLKIYIYRHNMSAAEDFFAYLTSNYESGWVILDYRRGREWSDPLSEFRHKSCIAESNRLCYVGSIQGQDIYRW